jgi:multimeric flavodoxin WrbA
MKAIAFNSSPRKDGNTSILLKQVLKELEKENISTEIINIGGTGLRGCIACGKCAQMKNKKCAISDDELNNYIEKMIDADAVILGSPTYFADVNAEMKAFIDRAGMVGMVNGGLYQRKPAAGLVAVRRGGPIHALDTLTHFFQIEQMLTVGSSYWNIGFGRNPGEVEQDKEGMQTISNLGKNMAWLLKCIECGKEKVKAPDISLAEKTNFIR